MARKCSLLTPLATALSSTKKITLKIQYNDGLKPIQTNAGQTSEGPEVLFGSDKLQKASNCFDDYWKLLHLPDWAGKLVRSSQLSYEIFCYYLLWARCVSGKASVVKMSGTLESTKMDRGVRSPRDVILHFLIPAGKR